VTRRPDRRLRLAFARISQESNALSPLRTTMDDFRAQHFLEGEDLLRRCGPLGNEAPGFVPWAELSGAVRAMRADGDVEPVPLFSAWAGPGGPLKRDCFDALAGRLEDELRRAGPLDGLVLVLHGAMGVDGVPAPDAALCRVAKEASGGVPLAITLDLHANLCRPLMEASDVQVAYATNPHRDHGRTGARATRILIDSLRGRTRPTSAWRSLPMLLGGGAEVDLMAPMRAIFRRARAMERAPGVLSTSLLMCHPWNDSPDLGWGTLAITDGDQALAEALADELAEACWAVRDVATPRFPGPEEAVAEAARATLARRLGVVVLSDASDVVAAGSSGDSTHLVRTLWEQGEGMVCYAAVRDPELARELAGRAVGAEVHVRAGGKLDPARAGEPIECDAVVRGTRTDPGVGRRVWLELDPPPHVARGRAGKVHLIVTEGPPLVMQPSFYESMGLRMRDADVVVVKSFFPFRLFFLPWARKTIYVRTRGLTDLDAAFVLEFDGPVHPRDRVEAWRPRDLARRRGVAAPPTASS
jgi:microcystin degradation protein MlrC